MLIASKIFNLKAFPPEAITNAHTLALTYLNSDTRSISKTRDESIKSTPEWQEGSMAMPSLFTFHFPLNETPQNSIDYLTEGLDTKFVHLKNKGESFIFQTLPRSALDYKGAHTCLSMNLIQDLDLETLTLRELIKYLLDKGVSYNPRNGNCLLENLIKAELEKEALEANLAIDDKNKKIPKI